jgi:hypothetical protein
MNEVQLHLPGGVGAPGFLSLPNVAAPILLTARHTSVLVQLAITRHRQANWPAEAAGWMPPKLIAEAICIDPKDYLVRPDTIRKYIGRIEETIGEHLPPDSQQFELFQKENSLGYRLAIPIQLFMPDGDDSTGATE